MIVSWWGALIGLAIAIILILRKVDAVYSLFIGAILGSLIGGANLMQTVNILVKGSQSVMGTVVRVLAAGVLAGVMMDSGAANTIARTIVDRLRPDGNFSIVFSDNDYYCRRCIYPGCGFDCSANCTRSW